METTNPPVVAGQVSGTATNDNAAAGQVGEYVEAEVAFASAVNLTTGVPVNVTSLSLTAGDWDVWGSVGFNPAGTTTETQIIATVNTVSATPGTTPYKGAGALQNIASAVALARIFPVGRRRLSLSATTPVYLIAQATFAISTQAAYGIICARRAR